MATRQASDARRYGVERGYWRPLFNALEGRGVELLVVNARHVKAVPGRKTDVKDAEWLADLLRHGLLKASFVPDRSPKRAAMAVAHSLMIAIYNMLRNGSYFVDLGPTHYDQRRRDLIARRSVRRLEELGYTVSIEEAVA